MAIKYIPYYPDTIEGQAILDNFTRTRRVLKYRDNDKAIERVRRGMPLYEMDRIETVGKNKDENLIIRGECLSACAYLKEQGKTVDLVYIDPPFASGADYAKKIYIRRNPKVVQAIAEAEEELQDDDLKAFEEKMYGDVWDKEKYLNWMYENLMAIKSVMSDTASIYVQLDSHIGHYVKILMDEIFGEENFINEIIWKRTFSHGDVGQGAQHLGRLHDVIFFYKKENKTTINVVYTPYNEKYVNDFYRYVDEDGRRYRLVSLLGPGGASKGNPYYEFLGVKRYWVNSKSTMQDLYEKGLIIQTKAGAVPQRKRYLDESPGVPLQDIWVDINAVQGVATENHNYATQKPEALLERIIKTSSNEGMIVADFFGGSGVTAAVAAKLGRKFIHCDVGINSIQTVRDRLIANKAEFDILEIKDGVSLYRNPVQTMDKLKSLIPGLRNEDALDKFWEGSMQTTKDGMVPVYIPNLMDSGTKLLDIVLMNRIIREAMPDLPDGVKKVIVFYIDIIDHNEIEEFIDENNDTLIEIELRDLKGVLDDVVIEDYAEYIISETQESLFTGWKVEIKKFMSDRVQNKILAYNQKGAVNSLRGDDESTESEPHKKRKKFTPITISEEGLELIEFLSLDCTSSNGVWNSDNEIKIDKLGFVICNGIKSKDFWDGTIHSEKKPLRLKIRNICGDESIYNLE